MRIRALSLLSLLVVGCADVTEPTPSAIEPALNTVASLGVARVTNSADDGPGSFRAAVAKANTDPSIRTIQANLRLAPIQLLSPVVLTATQDLLLQGLGMTLDGSALAVGQSNFVVTGGGSLDIVGLTVRDAPEQGMVVQIPADASGTKRFSLNGVVAEGNGGHGVEINDQEDPDDAGDPDNGIRGNSNGSPASLDVRVLASRFEGNGFSDLDRDGLRVNEGGLGSLTFAITGSRANDNGADGVELDERGVGDATFQIILSKFTGNGDFDQSAMPDKDDGFDADEVDGGNMTATVLLSSADDNFEEGWDFNENDAGDLKVVMRLSSASGNPEEGIDLEEDDDWQGGGDLIADLEGVVADRNGAVGGDGGIKIRERGTGMLEARVANSRASDNVRVGIHMREQQEGNLDATVVASAADGNDLGGVFLREDDAGDEVASVEGSHADGNGAIGIDFDENGDGNLTAGVTATSASNNVAHGIRADEAGNGTGTLTLTPPVTLDGNGSPGTTGNVPPTP